MRRALRHLATAAFAAALCATFASRADAQLAGSERIVALVGDDVILLSELEEQTVIAASQEGVDLDDVDAVAEVRRRVLDQMIEDLIVVAAAAADDSVQVSESSINEAAEAELNEIRSRFPSPAEFEGEIERSQWRTLENYRKNLRRIKHRELLAQAFLARHASSLKAATVSDQEVREYFERNKARFGNKPPTVNIDELTLLVRPQPEAKERARALADSLLAELRKGGDFAALAREFSDDAATSQRGGDLGYFGRGVMVPAFETAAFAIDSIGKIEGPVESAFGIHVIRLDDRQGDEIKARHILITPETSEADRASARALGEALVDSLRAGADFDSLRARHSDSPRGAEGGVEGPLAQLKDDWQSALRDLPIGGTTPLLEMPAGFSILRLRGRGGGEPYTFEELEGRLRSQLAQNRGQEAFVEGLRKQVYVEVRQPEAWRKGMQGELGGAAGATPAAAETRPAAADSVPGAAAEGYTPPAEEPETQGPLPALETPAPVADTPPPEEIPNPETITPVDGGPPGRVNPEGAVVDSTEQARPPRP